MKKMSLLTRKFISDNIKNNAAISSYPKRIVAAQITPKIQKKDDTIELIKGTPSKVSNYYSQ